MNSVCQLKGSIEAKKGDTALLSVHDDDDDCGLPFCIGWAPQGALTGNI